MNGLSLAIGLCLLLAANGVWAQGLALDDLITQNETQTTNASPLLLAPSLDDPIDMSALEASKAESPKKAVPMLSKKKPMQTRRQAAPAEAESLETVADATPATAPQATYPQPQTYAQPQQDVQPYQVHRPVRPWAQQGLSIVAPFVNIYTENGPHGQRTVVNAPFTRVDTERSVYGRRTVVDAPGTHVHTGADATGSGTVIRAPGTYIQTGTPAAPPPGMPRRVYRQYYRK